jgi:AmiR/NasT family two-component response regulator
MKLPQRRVVIAAEDAFLRRSLRLDLEALGYATWGEVSDGMAALTQSRRVRPHLVLLSPPLPSLDGGQVAETLIRGRVAPVVLVLTSERSAAVEAVPEESVCAWLIQPFTRRTLSEAIELARARFDRLSAIRTELQRLGRDRRGRMLLERVKSLLMRRLQIGEPEAFWRIQRHCLEYGEPVGAAVAAMIDANRLVLEDESLAPPHQTKPKAHRPTGGPDPSPGI